MDSMKINDWTIILIFRDILLLSLNIPTNVTKLCLSILTTLLKTYIYCFPNVYKLYNDNLMISDAGLKIR